MLPLHQLLSRLGVPLAKTVINVLAGDDSTSKLRTKHAAMASDPVQYLTNFGESDTLSEQYPALAAEEYLVRVWAGTRLTSTAKSFDQLRTETYISGSARIALPPQVVSSVATSTKEHFWCTGRVI